MPGNLFVLGLILTSVVSTFLFGGFLGGAGGGWPSVLEDAGLWGKKSLLIGTTSLLVGTGMGAVLPPGIMGGCPPWNGASRSLGIFAGPKDF